MRAERTIGEQMVEGNWQLRAEGEMAMTCSPVSAVRLGVCGR